MDTHAITLRLAHPDDAEDLQSYFRSLSKASRRDRFLAGIAEQSLAEIHRVIGSFSAAFFCVIATRRTGCARQIIGESVCAVAAIAELALSVDDSVQNCGLGRALLAAVESLALQRGASELRGTTFDTNDRMKMLARSRGYIIERSGDDWTQRVIRKALPACDTLPFRSGPSMAASALPYLKGALRDAVSCP
jgi:GNAT superfamily N-acetyltransferase